MTMFALAETIELGLQAAFVDGPASLEYARGYDWFSSDYVVMELGPTSKVALDGYLGSSNVSAPVIQALYEYGTVLARKIVASSIGASIPSTALITESQKIRRILKENQLELIQKTPVEPVQNTFNAQASTVRSYVSRTASPAVSEKVEARGVELKQPITRESVKTRVSRSERFGHQPVRMRGG